jgi:hypothetical protein
VSLFNRKGAKSAKQNEGKLFCGIMAQKQFSEKSFLLTRPARSWSVTGALVISAGHGPATSDGKQFTQHDT